MRAESRIQDGFSGVGAGWKPDDEEGGRAMDGFDVMILASMGVLAVFFASVAVAEWWDARAERRRLRQRPDAQVIQHPQRDRSASAA
jgi:hypothetical protein